MVDPLTDDDTVLDRTLGWFHDEGWVRLEDEDQISVVNREPLESLRGIMSDILEVYYLALVATETGEQGGVAQKIVMKKIMKIAQDLRGSDESRPLPSLSSVTVGNALTRFFEMGILEYRASRKYLGAVTDAAHREKLQEFLGHVLETERSAAPIKPSEPGPFSREDVLSVSQDPITAVEFQPFVRLVQRILEVWAVRRFDAGQPSSDSESQLINVFLAEIFFGRPVGRGSYQGPINALRQDFDSNGRGGPSAQAYSQKHSTEIGIKQLFLMSFFLEQVRVRKGTSPFYLIISHIVLIRQG